MLGPRLNKNVFRGLSTSGLRVFPPTISRKAPARNLSLFCYSGNRTYANRSNAERAAKMQWERLQRGVASFSLQLAEGRADLYTEMPVKVSGFKQLIDDAEWTITTLTHTVSPDNGFTTSIELEVKIDDLEME
ncbi:TPA: contractile injection system protein, VgrG/Pvc8 family [Escherichia coli]